MRGEYERRKHGHGIHHVGISEYYICICLQGFRKAMTNLDQDSEYSGQNPKDVPPTVR
jgi:hypothetical protein